MIHVPSKQEIVKTAAQVFREVFRIDFRAPGFALLRLDASVGSRELRRFMVALKEALDAEYHRRYGRRLVYLSMGRFDQQTTTKFHLDGAPEVSFLMLGYEPSEVRSVPAVADYSRAAFDRGIEPRQFLTELNPMFAPGEQAVAPYVTRLAAFDSSAPQVLLLNNSSQAFVPGAANQLGVMHQATILDPSPRKRRVVNSTMIGAVADRAEEPVAEAVQRVFLETDAVAGEL
jgi:hypothetical protein